MKLLNILFSNLDRMIISTKTKVIRKVKVKSLTTLKSFVDGTALSRSIELIKQADRIVEYT